MTTKKLRSGGLTTADHAAQKYTDFHEIVPSDVSYQDIFYPSYWHHVAEKMRPYDIIRVSHADGDFDVFVTVRHVVAGGAVIDFLMGRAPAGINAAAASAESVAKGLEIQIAPIGDDGKSIIHIEFLPKTQWRLLGLGSEEVVRGLPTKEAAQTEMNNYLHRLRLRLPTDDEIAAEVKKRAGKAEKKAAPANA